MTNNYQHILFRDVVTTDAQWRVLSRHLSNAAPTRGWRALGETLLSKSTIELDDIQRINPADPTRTLLNDWQCTNAATMQNLFTALRRIDNATVIGELESWIDEYRKKQNPNVKNDTAFFQTQTNNNIQQPFVQSPQPSIPTYPSNPQPPVAKNDTSLHNIPSSDLKQLEKIGEGSFAVVYKGLWHGSHVALKELRLVNMSKDLKEECLHEATLLAKCQFPRIVKLYGISIDQDKYTMVMEYVPRGSLYSVLGDKSITLPWDVRIQIAKGIAQGVAYLHHINMVHCDLKSLNVLLDESFQPKLSDFGLVKIKTGTQTGTIRPVSQTPGTTRWLAPEIFLGSSSTPASDVYSMGMVFWEIASRKHPYSNAPTEIVVMGLIMGNRTETIPEDCPPSFGAVITSCWKTVKERPTAAACEIFLGDVLQSSQQPPVTSNQGNLFSPPVNHVQHNQSAVASGQISSQGLGALSDDHIFQLVPLLDTPLFGSIPAVTVALSMGIGRDYVQNIAHAESPTRSLIQLLKVYGSEEQRTLNYLHKKLLEQNMFSAAAIVKSAVW